MGWSCSKAVSDLMKRWEVACLSSTDSQNSWRENGRMFFWEADPREYADGGVSGKVFEDKGHTAMRVGSVKVEGSGTVTRAPAFLKGVANG